MRKYFFILLCLFSLAELSACLNELRVNLKGKAEVGDDRFYVPYGRRLEENKIYYEKRLHKLDSLWKVNKEIEDYLDYGVHLVYLGRYEEAKKVFITTEKSHPGMYATAANLGTTYELLGNNELALHWIKRAVEIDPESHQGSEWLHVKILEAKIKGDSYIITSDFLISTHFGNEELPVTTMSKDEIRNLREQILYQLNERVSFIKPEDKIVALLLFELGNTCALLDDVTSALRVYDEAKKYGYSTPVFEKRYRKLLELHKGYDHRKIIDGSEYSTEVKGVVWGLGGAFIIVMITLIYFLYKNRKSSK